MFANEKGAGKTGLPIGSNPILPRTPTPEEFRLKNLPPLAPNAMWAKYFPMGAERINWKSRHVTGDPTPGPIKRGLGMALHQWGGGGTQDKQVTCIINPDGSVPRDNLIGKVFATYWPPNRISFR